MRRSTLLATTGWLVTRLLMIWLLVDGPEWRVRGDLSYFASSLRTLSRDGLASTLVEYPVPAVGALLVPWRIGHGLGLTDSFQQLVIVIALLTDGAFLVLLGAGATGRRVEAMGVWVVAVPLLGATAYARFDVLPGVLVGVALLLLARRPVVAGVCLAVATGVKLWPVLLLPGSVLAAPRRGRMVLAVGLTGLGLVAASVTVAGWARLVSPLRYQTGRGLQIESVAATPVMAARLADPSGWRVFYSSFHAFEVVGPGTRWLTAVSTVATLLLALALGAVWLFSVRRGRISPDVVVWLTLAATSGFVATGKVFSPQYVLWLLPAAAAGLTLVAGHRRLLAWTAGLLVLAALTQVVYPLRYGEVDGLGQVGTVGTLALVVRNLLLVVLTGWAWTEVVRVLRAPRREVRPPVAARR